MFSPLRMFAVYKFFIAGVRLGGVNLIIPKNQYHDFMMLLQSIEFMSRASQFRKYKARNNLENLPNYHGKYRELWKFAFDCVYEEEVMRRINNWSWNHMKEHLQNCKKYRVLYKQKLTSKKENQDLLNELLQVKAY